MNKNNFKKHNPITNESGLALVLAMIMVVVIGIIAVSNMNISVTEKHLTNNYHYTRQAFYAAEAGAQDGVYRLIIGTITDSSPTETTWNSTNYSSTGFSNTFTVKHLLNSSGSAVVNDSAGNPYYVISSTGWDSSAKKAEKTVEIIVSLTRSAGVYSAGMIGCQNVTVTGSGLIDSYDSALGSYASQATNTDTGGNTYAGNNGSSSTCETGSNINFTANAPMHGNLSAPGTVNPPGGGAFYGTETEGIAATSCDPLGVVAYLAAKWPTPATTTAKITTDKTLASGASYHYKSIALTGSETITITGSGTINIFVDEDISMTASAAITVPAGVTLNIYNKGQIDMSGQGVVNAGGDPSKVNIYNSYVDTGVVDHVKFTGSGAFYGTVYAPLANVRMSGSGGTYGSARGRLMTKTGTADFHYDEALGRLGGGGTITGYHKEQSRDL